MVLVQFFQIEYLRPFVEGLESGSNGLIEGIEDFEKEGKVTGVKIQWSNRSQNPMEKLSGSMVKSGILWQMKLGAFEKPLLFLNRLGAKG